MTSFYKFSNEVTVKIPPMFDALWEEVERSPTHVYAPTKEGDYRLIACRAVREELVSLDDWQLDRKPDLIWKIVCSDLHNYDDWGVATCLFIKDAAQVVVLKSDTVGIDEILLIERKFLISADPPYLKNKWNIPLKACRFIEHIPVFGGGTNYLWCEIHNCHGVEGDPVCGYAIPHEHVPCELESDQGGTYCNTHGGFVDDYGTDICDTYKGPTETITEYGAKKLRIPLAYRTCDFVGDSKCFTHDGKKVNKQYCEYYDGPYKLLG